ncbi:MAG: DUF370 domain-containing protein [Turicibacter sp.]|nr:DUF370 domain-containing protein [Turicibacter sp.]
MWNKPINIGFGNIVPSSRVVAIIAFESAPTKRIVQEARSNNILVDATQGRRTRSVIVTDSNHIVLSALQPETLATRLQDTKKIEAKA